MKTQILILSIILTLFSCDNSQERSITQHESPKALEDKKSYEIITKRGSYNDLVESLYAELVDKTPELKELEDKIDYIYNSKKDSTELFYNYDEKNRNYYNSASQHIEDIKDSVLRQKMAMLISKSLTKYDSKISQHSSLLKSIDKRTLTLSDLHTTLKITKTLPLIEKYQNNLPTTKPIWAYSKKLDKTIKFADILTK